MSNWISVEDKPLISFDDDMWELTDEGEAGFICYVPTKAGGFMQMCEVDDKTNLITTDGEWAEEWGYSVHDVTDWQPLLTAPQGKPG